VLFCEMLILQFDLFLTFVFHGSYKEYYLCFSGIGEAHPYTRG
jgi:hypothetical protein